MRNAVGVDSWARPRSQNPAAVEGELGSTSSRANGVKGPEIPRHTWSRRTARLDACTGLTLDGLYIDDVLVVVRVGVGGDDRDRTLDRVEEPRALHSDLDGLGRAAHRRCAKSTATMTPTAMARP